MCDCTEPPDHECRAYKRDGTGQCKRLSVEHREDGWGRFACSDECLELLEREVGACEAAQQAESLGPLWVWCVVCHKVQVDANDGYDTCLFCLGRQ